MAIPRHCFLIQRERYKLTTSLFHRLACGDFEHSMSCCDFKNIFILSDAFGKTDSNIFDKSAWSLSDTKISSLSQVDFSERFLGLNVL